MALTWLLFLYQSNVFHTVVTTWSNHQKSSATLDQKDKRMKTHVVPRTVRYEQERNAGEELQYITFGLCSK